MTLLLDQRTQSIKARPSQPHGSESAAIHSYRLRHVDRSDQSDRRRASVRLSDEQVRSQTAALDTEASTHNSFWGRLVLSLSGRAMLSYLGVTMHAFAVSGGVLLFLLAVPMLFGQRSSLQSPEGGERSADEDVAIFPMAIPMLAGPGTIATVLVLATQAGGDVRRLVVLAITLATIYLISWPILHASDRLITRLG